MIVGINDYASAPCLSGCIADAVAVAQCLERNEDKTVNFRCELLTSEKGGMVTAPVLRQRLHAHLDQNFTGDALLYFSGHGAATSLGAHLLTYEGAQFSPGVPMRELVDLANRSRARNVFIFLDCCYAGAAGSDEEVVGSFENEAKLREGVTILAAARPRQGAHEVAGHGVFTRLVLAALAGGAADIRGRVSTAGIYAYADAVLGALDQRPIYKSHAASLEPIRLCRPTVSDEELRQLPTLFREPMTRYSLAPSYEETFEDVAVPEHVVVFKAFKRLQTAGLLRCEVGQDLYWMAVRSQGVELTPLGQLYWELATAGQI
ncbi:caspase family protein [Komagataeibacter europaeus]|uniref:caspase family protein n=1 Tax=Komagataeibacter europaeus TaxID=33995 RepID=UPI001650F40E|nr:caspase family protein [Komagataeibacter europaeus]